MVSKIIIIRRDKGILLRDWLIATHGTQMEGCLGDFHKLALDTDPDDGSVVRAWVGGWANFPRSWWDAMSSHIQSEGWDIPGTDGASYNMSAFSYREALADTTKKPVAFRRVPVPRDGLYPGE